MIWKDEYSRSDEDTLNFKSTSNEIIGTWTRTKNKAASCKISNEYEYDSWWDCKDDWETTKVVITETIVEITRDICYTDDILDGEENQGWKYRVIDCTTAELYKGADKITEKATINDVTFSYKGESCKIEFESPKSKKEAACRETWNRYQDTEYYWEILNEDFENCMKRIMPSEFYNDDEDDYLGKLAAKPAAKTKFTPLLKKKNQRY